MLAFAEANYGILIRYSEGNPFITRKSDGDRNTETLPSKRAIQADCRNAVHYLRGVVQFFPLLDVQQARGASFLAPRGSVTGMLRHGNEFPSSGHRRGLIARPSLT
jgi:hypothetical protein